MSMIRTQPIRNLHGCEPGLVCRRGRFDAIELLRIAPENFVPSVFVAVCQTAFNAIVHLIAVQRCGMRKVSFKPDVVNADFVEQAVRRHLLKPVAGVDIWRKICRRQHVQIGPLFRHPVAEELVVEGF